MANVEIKEKYTPGEVAALAKVSYGTVINDIQKGILKSKNVFGTDVETGKETVSYFVEFSDAYTYSSKKAAESKKAYVESKNASVLYPLFSEEFKKGYEAWRNYQISNRYSSTLETLAYNAQVSRVDLKKWLKGYSIPENEASLENVLQQFKKAGFCTTDISETYRNAFVPKVEDAPVYADTEKKSGAKYPLFQNRIQNLYKHWSSVKKNTGLPATQKAFAETSGIHFMTMSRMLNGAYICGDETAKTIIEGIAKDLGEDPDYGYFEGCEPLKANHYGRPRTIVSSKVEEPAKEDLSNKEESALTVAEVKDLVEDLPEVEEQNDIQTNEPESNARVEYLESMVEYYKKAFEDALSKANRSFQDGYSAGFSAALEWKK